MNNGPMYMFTPCKVRQMCVLLFTCTFSFCCDMLIPLVFFAVSF